MRLLARIIPRSVDPIRAIEWVIAVFTLVGGTYLFTPLYGTSVSQNGLSALAQVFAHPAMILLWGALLVVSALLVMYGLWKNLPQVRSAGWFGIILARTFQLLTTFTVAGLLPISWIFPMTITVVVIVLWGNARVEVRRNASD